MNKTYEKDALQYIAKVAEGGMRIAISYLDKCLSYSNEITVENVVKALGINDYDKLYNLLSYILKNDTNNVIELIEDIYANGKDLKIFIKQFIQFILDTEKYLLYNNYDYIQIPNIINLNIFMTYNNVYERLLNLLENMIELNNQIKYEQNPKVLIESRFIIILGGNNNENK